MSINNLSDKELLAMAYDAKKIMDKNIFRLYKVADRYGVSRDSVVIATLMAALDDYGEVHIVYGNEC